MIEEGPVVTEDLAQEGLIPSIRASLDAKLERLLRRPLVARVVDAAPDVDAFLEDDGLPDIFRELDHAIQGSAPELGVARVRNPWREDPNDGTCNVRIAIDYDDLWRGCEREVLEAVSGTIESFVTFLTDEQRLLLERSPREFLALDPRPESAELVGFKKEMVGGVERVVELVLAEPPKSQDFIRSLAVVPNLVPLERQLTALHIIETSTPDSELAPLRALVGLPADFPDAPEVAEGHADITFLDRLDEYQQECVKKALTTPHFAVIQGPPGSGKTTVITTVIRHALARGGRVLVVSPTHVAVDNVVEKLAPEEKAETPDDLECRTLPVRFAARPKKLLESAARYWIGPKKQRRAPTVARRLERRLRAVNPLAKALFALMDEKAEGHAPLTQAVASVQGVVCGTPIGVLSFPPVKLAAPGEYDLLIVDEVSKMTLPEFLAVAVKAKRWVLVGDPEQLPPFNNAEENGVALDDLIDPRLELVCSVGAILERERPGVRRDTRLVVVSTDPDGVAHAIHEHLQAVDLEATPSVLAFSGEASPGVVVCAPDEIEDAVALVAPVRGRDRTFDPRQPGSVRILVERGVAVARPEFASGTRLVEPRLRAPARVFDTSFAVYHAQPWQVRAEQKLDVVRFRNGMNKYLPSAGALAALAGADRIEEHHHVAREALIDHIAERYAVNAVSVYDWLTGIPVEHFDVSPLCNLERVGGSHARLQATIRPFVGTLRKQYRMHSSLSKVPRELFYFGEALEDGKPDAQSGCRVRLIQVRDPGPSSETNPSEVRAICDLLSKLNATGASSAGPRQRILVITPYRAQERELTYAIDAVARREGLDHLDVEVCTLDRCQGREAEYVFISLVRNRATPFLNAPKRWNVALTRAMNGMFIFGDIDAYLQESTRARRYVAEHPRETRPLMSLLARILEAYDRQIASYAMSRRNQR